MSFLDLLTHLRKYQQTSEDWIFFTKILTGSDLWTKVSNLKHACNHSNDLVTGHICLSSSYARSVTKHYLLFNLN